MPEFSKTCALLVCWNSAETISPCLASIPDGVEVVVVDNASTDGTDVLVQAKFPFVRLIESEKNLGFGAGCNLAATGVNGKDILLLNPDSTLDEKCLEKLMLFLEKHPSCG
ncbi:MAG TPA: glycosyltransferase, partial [Chroococcales cyanobacterium]